MSSQTQENEEDLQIMQTIQNRIQQAALSQPEFTLRNAERTYPVKPADIPYNLTMYANLASTKALIPAYSTEFQRNQNSLTKLPVIGKIIQTLQTQLHQVALFYTIRALNHQQEVNEHLFACIEELTIETQTQQRMIYQLEEEIHSMQKEPAT